MKKYLSLVLGVVFILGFAASAFAIHAEIPSETQAVVSKGATQITIGGEIRVRGEYKNNNEDFNSDIQTSSAPTGNVPVTQNALAGRNREGAFYDQRVRLSIEAKVTPNTSGMIQIESGNADNTDNVTWGNYEASGATGTYQQGNAKHGDLRILQAWILHQGSGLLGIPALVKVGHMPIKVGTGLFIDHSKFGDDAILLGISPVKNMDLIGAIVKTKEGNNALSDDGNVYAVLLNYPVDKNLRIGGDVTWVNQQNLGETTSAAGVFPDISLWNVGINGDVMFDFGLGLYADFEYQTGHISDLPGVGSARSINLQAFAGKVGATFTIAPVKLTLEGAYGSGDNNPNDSRDKTFVTSLGVDQHFTYVYEYSTPNAAGNRSGGLQNTWYVKLGGNFDIMKDLNADLSAYYLSAVKSVINQCQPGVACTPATTFPISGNGQFWPHQSNSKYIGTELDYKFTYKIDRNLQYWVEGGYLFAGHFWNAITGSSKNPDDVWAIRQGIQLNF